MAQENELQETLKLLEHGRKLFKFTADDLILIMGLSGTGKTTLFQILTSDMSSLTAKLLKKNTNEFIITDTDGRISEETIISKTIIPDVLSDTNNCYYCDCPGFNDTRNSSIDIASTCFHNIIIGHARRVKLVFMINYASLREGVDRYGFMDVVRHATTFIKDIKKFRDSIAIVASKVDNETFFNEQSEQYELISDHDIKEIIVEFIAKAKRSEISKINSKKYSEEEKELFRKNIEFMDIFSSVHKIGLLRRPNKCGPLNQIKIMQKSKEKLQKLFMEQQKFVACHKNDFQHTLSERTLRQIPYLLSRITDEILERSTKLSTVLMPNYMKKIDTAPDYKLLLDDMIQDVQKMQDILRKIHQAKTIGDYVTCLKHIINIFCDRIEYRDILEKISQQDVYWKLLETLTPANVVFKSKKCQEIFEKNLQMILEWKIWMQFLFKLDAIFCSYDFNKRYLKCWDKTISKLKIKPNNLQSLLDQLQKVIGSAFFYAENIQIDHKRLQQYHLLLDITTEQNVVAKKYTENKLTVKGGIIKMSEVNELLSIKSAKIVQILAYNRIIIDEDFERIGNNANLTMVAPVWFIVGNQTIRLDGQSADEHSKKARNGRSPGQDGNDGKPGLPGCPGGNFFGICQLVVGGHLAISANGGCGGDGQDGGDGADGEDGQTRSGLTVYNCMENKNYDSDINVEFLDHKGFIFGYNSYHLLRFRGRYLGKKGGCGGNGGKRGKGGQHGSIKIVNMQENWPIDICPPINGENGIDGNGGRGGSGGKNAPDLKVETTVTHDECGVSLPAYKVTEEINRGRAPSGEDGSKGANRDGRKTPDEPEPCSKLYKILENYKSNLRELLVDKFHRAKFIEFLHYLSKNEDIISEYDHFGYTLA